MSLGISERPEGAKRTLSSTIKDFIWGKSFSDQPKAFPGSSKQMNSITNDKLEETPKDIEPIAFSEPREGFLDSVIVYEGDPQVRPPVLPILPIQRLRLLRQKQEWRRRRDYNSSLYLLPSTDAAPSSLVLNLPQNASYKSALTRFPANMGHVGGPQPPLKRTKINSKNNSKGTKWSGELEYDLAEYDTAERPSTPAIQKNLPFDQVSAHKKAVNPLKNSSVDGNVNSKQISSIQRQVLLNGQKSILSREPSDRKKENVEKPAKRGEKVVLPSVGFDFIKSSDTPSKVKMQQREEDENEDEPRRKKRIAKPSNLSFKFGAGPAVNTNENEKSKVSFALDEKKNDNETSKSVPSFSFTSKKDEQSNDSRGSNNGANEKPKAPSFNFGAKNNELKPAFSFGTKKDENEVSKPSFVFGDKKDKQLKPDGKDDKPKPAFSFGVGKSGDETSKPSLNFSDKKSEFSKPTFSFGDKKTDDSKPTFNFGPKKDDNEVSKPSFNFGAKKSESEVSKPTFNFGPKKSEPEVSKPSFNFGAKKSEPEESKPTFSFGVKKSESQESKPTFSFGAKKDDAEVPKPTFSFGAKKDDAEVPKPTFSFGAKKDDAEVSKPTFSFGTKKDETEGSKPKPSFSFGVGGQANTKSNGDSKVNFGPGANNAPSFNFNSKKDEIGEGAKSMISFGKEGNQKPAFETNGKSKVATESTPKFNFGANPSETKQDGNNDSKATFSFGTGTSGPQRPMFSFGSNGAEGSFNKSAPNFGQNESKQNDKPNGFSFTRLGGSTQTSTLENSAQSASAANQTFGLGSNVANNNTPSISTNGNSVFAPNPQPTQKPFSFTRPNSDMPWSNQVGSTSNAPTNSSPSFNFKFGADASTSATNNPFVNKPSGFTFGNNNGFGASQAAVPAPSHDGIIPAFGNANNALGGSVSPPVLPNYDVTNRSFSPSNTINLNFGGNASTDPNKIFSGNSENLSMPAVPPQQIFGNSQPPTSTFSNGSQFSAGGGFGFNGPTMGAPPNPSQPPLTNFQLPPGRKLARMRQSRRA